MAAFRPRQLVRVLALLLVPLLVAACQPAAPAASEATTIRIAKQPGLSYLPLIVMREQKLIEKRLPGVITEWRDLASTTAVRDAMIARQLDVGSGGAPPFIEAYDRGLTWKITGAMSNMPLYLVVNKPGLTALKDFTPADKIALPTPGGAQHITLQMAAEQQLGDPHALDDRIVAMAHPDAQAALLSRQEVAGHFSSPPFQYDELARGGPDVHVLVDSYAVMGGPHTFTVAMAMDDWAARNPKLFQAFVDAQTEATEFIRNDPAAAARLYVEGEKATQTPEEILRQMQVDGVEFTTTPLGMLKYAAFMQRIGTIKSIPASWQEYTFPNLHALGGS
jgi:NitT/TauT family transport system substrate-binding protein